MVKSTQSISKGGGDAIEEGTHVMNALVVWFTVYHREGHVWKVHEILFDRERHYIHVNGSGIRELGY